MRLNKEVMLSIVALPFCAALIGCADTTMERFPFESGVVQPATRPAPVIKAPVYKNGDWWKVKVVKSESSQKWQCYHDYSDYLLEIQEGKPKLYGINGTNKKEFDCPRVEDGILGKIRRKLKFPLRVGNSWNHRFLKETAASGTSAHWPTIQYNVLDWEKIQTAKGVFEAVKLSSYYFQCGEQCREYYETYYYSPKVKAIILYNDIKVASGTLTLERIVTVVDFNVSN